MLIGQELHMLDGGFGSLLAREGYDIDASPIWSGGAIIDCPDLVRKCHQMFIEAGADIIATNTYHCCIKTMMQTMQMTETQVADVFNRAVTLARDAIGRSSNPAAILVGSIGPYATLLRDGSEYSGAYTKEPNFESQTIIDYYRMQTRALIRAGVKKLAFETVPTLIEVQCIGEVAQNLPEDTEITWISFTCKDGKSTAGGDDFSAVTACAASSVKGLQYLGINCTSPLHITELLERAKGSNIPFVVYANSGETFEPLGKRFCGERKVASLLEQMPIWEKLGARIFGGCCRVYPEDIQQIAEGVEQMKQGKLI